MDQIEIHPIAPDDIAWIKKLLQECWGSVNVVSRGRLYHADQLSGFIAAAGGTNIGLVTYSVNGTECEVVTLNSIAEIRGAGSALMKAVESSARNAGCTHLRVVTTNDNLKALRFYQKRGFVLAALRCKAVEQSRRLKPEIPLIGYDGIPIRDEIELELLL